MEERVAELENATMCYGGFKAVDGLTLALGPGRIVGFLGVNGAGKTTTIKMLTGLARPTSGKVRVFGGDPCDPKVRTRLGYAPETATYYPFLTARELLKFYGGVCAMEPRAVKERSEALLEAVGLGEAAGRPLKTYSKGMLQRAGLAQALLPDPDFIILDEPFTGLDPLARVRLRNLLKELRDRGKTIFFSSHELGETEMLCDSVAVMKGGKCIYSGSVERLKGDGRGSLERMFLELLEKGGV